MARYSPRDPGYTRVPGVLDALSHIATSGAAGYTGTRLDRERRVEEERLRGIEEEERAISRHGRGYVGREGAFEEVPEEEDIFRDVDIGMQQQRDDVPSIFRGAGVGMAPDRGSIRPPQGAGPGIVPALESIQRAAPATEPELVALPGSWVNGMGFTPRAITSDDLVGATRSRMAPPRERMRPGVEQVTDDVFFDPARSPEGRAEERTTRRDREERARLEAALRGLEGAGGGDIPPEIQAELVGQVPGSTLFPDDDDETIRVGGRDFPNDATGQTAALEWQRVLAEARRSGAGNEPDRITGEVTRRQIAMAAARAIQRVRDEVRELSEYERRNLPAGYLTEQINRIAGLFGYGSPGEVEEEMRTLRLEGVGGPPPAAGGGGGAPPPAEIPDELIDELIEANPDASPEEILELARQRSG